ncbi:hypothetical protein LV89_01716 [Arcicella aurantiaca]|uniref:Secreted protein (Por secretion system target) n=1 Tax=Arcicella aurantiaca TaxID=591202 RepID=A0A316ECQ2_9BACT|nr:hypothetical protein [Arcicella aurantiaca]PWK27403.1 hypothetical protein LV89_01716 [Arcicella aurantiaca]
MKTLVKTFAIAVLSAMTFIANAKDNNVEPTKAKTFEVGMFQTINSLKMNIMIEKTTDENLLVVLKDEKGEILVREHVSKKDKNYHGKYDMSQLEDGKYTFEFTKGDEKIVKEVNLVTTKPTTINRQIALQ